MSGAAYRVPASFDRFNGVVGSVGSREALRGDAYRKYNGRENRDQSRRSLRKTDKMISVIAKIREFLSDGEMHLSSEICREIGISHITLKYAVDSLSLDGDMAGEPIPGKNDWEYCLLSAYIAKHGEEYA